MSSLTEVLLSATVLFGLWWLFFVEYPQLVLDNTRQRLFYIRDHLFEQAANGEVPFESDAYVMIRNTLNGMIQYAHHVRPWTLLAIRWAEARLGSDPQGERFMCEFDAAIRELPLPAQRVAGKTLTAMNVTMLKHVIYATPFGAALYVLIRTVLIVTLRHKNRFDRFVRGASGSSYMHAIDAKAQAIAKGYRAAGTPSSA